MPDVAVAIAAAITVTVAILEVQKVERDLVDVVAIDVILRRIACGRYDVVIAIPLLLSSLSVAKGNAAAAAAAATDYDDNADADDADAEFLIEIEIDQGVVEVGSSSRRRSIHYCC